MCNVTDVELGFLVNCEPWQVESRLFPSKVGGKPAWLSLENVPTFKTVQCPKCQKTMIFLCQVYAPYEEENMSEEFKSNFHRTLFVFVCRDPDCCERNCSNNVKVFRSSLPRNNKFYSIHPPEGKPDPDFSLDKWVKLCNLCGCYAEKQCSQCKNVNYCCRAHQVQDWKESHKATCHSINKSPNQSTLLFSEWEIITESEENQATVINEEEELKKFKQLESEGTTGTMRDISETDLDAHATTERDKVFSKFKKKISQNPDQVIRYQRGGQPLLIAKEPLPENIPNCEYCEGPRHFEFQIMPQMLSMLHENSLDWGIIGIYTCKKSCKGDDVYSYKNEFAFKQDVELNEI